MRKVDKQMRGFTLVESLVVVAVVSIVVATAVVSTNGSSQNTRADSAATTVLSQLRLAHMVAITQRRNVVVTIDTNFSGPDNLQHVNFQVVALPGEPVQPVQSMPLPPGTQFVLEPGVPDTPEQFGNAEAVFFGDTSGGTFVMQFTPIGTFVDANNNVLNGTIFLGVPGVPGTARAVTVMGGDSNIQRFTWTGLQWVS